MYIALEIKQQEKGKLMQRWRRTVLQQKNVHVVHIVHKVANNTNSL